MIQTISTNVNTGLSGEGLDSVDDFGLDFNVNEEREDTGEIFHVVDCLACGFMLGEAFLENFDTFNQGVEIPYNTSSKIKEPQSLKMFQILSPFQARFFTWKEKRLPEMEKDIELRIHNDAFRAERYRRSKAKRAIEELVEPEKNALQKKDNAAIQTYDWLHARCIHCSATQSS